MLDSIPAVITAGISFGIGLRILGLGYASLYRLMGSIFNGMKF